MREVVSNGTARGISPVLTLAKTGTAQGGGNRGNDLWLAGGFQARQHRVAFVLWTQGRSRSASAGSFYKQAGAGRLIETLAGL
jgi:hypothetical protein